MYSKFKSFETFLTFYDAYFMTVRTSLGWDPAELSPPQKLKKYCTIQHSKYWNSKCEVIYFFEIFV